MPTRGLYRPFLSSTTIRKILFVFLRSERGLADCLQQHNVLFEGSKIRMTAYPA